MLFLMKRKVTMLVCFAYPTNVGAPVIKIDNILDWKSVELEKLTKNLKVNSMNLKPNMRS